MFAEMGDNLEFDELHQVLNRLIKLRSVTEPSSLVGRVEETIGQIQAIVDKGAAGDSGRAGFQ